MCESYVLLLNDVFGVNEGKHIHYKPGEILKMVEQERDTAYLSDGNLTYGVSVYDIAFMGKTIGEARATFASHRQALVDHLDGSYCVIFMHDEYDNVTDAGLVSYNDESLENSIWLNADLEFTKDYAVSKNIPILYLYREDPDIRFKLYKEGKEIEGVVPADKFDLEEFLRCQL